MQIFSGRGVYGGIAIGRIQVYKNDEIKIKRQRVDDVLNEAERFSLACTICDNELKELYEKSIQEIGESNAAIFEIHRMMLSDRDYTDAVENIIRNEAVNAEYAVSITAENFSRMFSSMEDDYMTARAADVRDISDRIIRILTRSRSAAESIADGGIILADDLSPSETVQLDKSKVIAFVTLSGSANSHTAILARTMNIPSIVQCAVPDISALDGMLCIVDGFSGKLYVDPDEDTQVRMSKKKLDADEKRKLLESLKGAENITRDGKHIKVYANIGGTGDLSSVLENDAGGIGLLRSEFIYLERDAYPTEDEQYSIYRHIIRTMAGKPVIIRTLDIGADKNVGYFDLEKEENPALGYRAIRICLDRTELFKTQLRAILRAAAYGNASIMYPMITSVEEVKRIKSITDEARRELDNEGIPYGNVSEGIMIETPAAAIISDMLAPEVDFFSIGTNDLSQYTLAIDRQNPHLDSFFNPHHPAILRMIKDVIDNAHRHGIWAGICGELGSDTTMTARFLKMGIDELSVSPSSVLPIRKIILESYSR